MALLKCRLLYFSSRSSPGELHYNADHGEYYASPSQRVVGAGGAGEVQGEHEQLGFGRLLIPARKKNKAANDRASTSCEVSVMTAVRRNGTSEVHKA